MEDQSFRIWYVHKQDYALDFGERYEDIFVLGVVGIGGVGEGR